MLVIPVCWTARWRRTRCRAISGKRRFWRKVRRGRHRVLGPSTDSTRGGSSSRMGWTSGWLGRLLTRLCWRSVPGAQGRV